MSNMQFLDGLSANAKGVCTFCFSLSVALCVEVLQLPVAPVHQLQQPILSHSITHMLMVQGDLQGTKRLLLSSCLCILKTLCSQMR